MPATHQSNRPSCATCLRAQSNCICSWVRPIEHRVEVLILQHPLEVSQVKGTARLLQLSLNNSRLMTGEIFDASLIDSQKYSILLYPNSPQDTALGLPVPPVLPQNWLNKLAQLRLVVLDGTWRKSRKMLYLNPMLQQMPRLTLQDVSASKYLIRKAHRPDQLSTLEAVCAALTQLEGEPKQFDVLLRAFEGFVLQQARYTPNGSNI
jgi:DTW domain-containing protein